MGVSKKELKERMIMNKVKKPFYKKVWFWVVIVIIIAAAGKGGGSKSSDKSTKEKTTAVKQEANEEKAETTTSVGEDTKDSEEEQVSKEFQNAYKKAETYYSIMHMSKASIYDQLTSEYGENFADDAAKYAVDKLDATADWNDAALKKAETYYSEMHMSKDSIYDQLTSEYGEKFEDAAAKYAVDKLDATADWNDAALKKAKTYQEEMSMSKSAIYDQLTSEYGEKFTAEQAQYAIDNLPD